MNSAKFKNLNLLLGPTLLLLCILVIPESAIPNLETRAAIGTVAWMAFWWITSCIDYAVTAFLPLIVNAIIPMVPMADVTAKYASEMILLLLGASILTVSWEVTHLDKRIASTLLAFIGTSLKSQIVFWFMLAVVLSSVLPNSVVCATIIPIAVSMLKFVGEKDISKSNSGSMILMSIAWGAGIGGLASPLGGAMNLVIVDYIEDITGVEFMYIDWVIRFLPIVLVLIVSNLIYLLILVPKGVHLEGSKDFFVKMNNEMEAMTRNEKQCLALFVIATGLSFTRNLYSDYLPGLKPAFIFLGCAVISFLITRDDGSRLMVWDNVQKKIIWSLIYIFAGGLAAGALINGSGADIIIGNLLMSLGLDGGFSTILVIVILTIIMSDITSNTATAAVAIPIVIALVTSLNLNPIPYVFAASIGVNLSYVLPTSIRAIPVGYGLEPSFMFKKGLGITVVVIALMSSMAWLLITYWPAFSTAS